MDAKHATSAAIIASPLGQPCRHHYQVQRFITIHINITIFLNGAILRMNFSQMAPWTCGEPVIRQHVFQLL